MCRFQEHLPLGWILLYNALYQKYIIMTHIILKKLLAPFFIAITILSCDKQLNEPIPDNAVGSDNISAGDIPLLINGTYSKMLGSALQQSYPMFDIYSDDVISVQGGSPTQFDPQSYDANNPN